MTSIERFYRYYLSHEGRLSSHSPRVERARLNEWIETCRKIIQTKRDAEKEYSVTRSESEPDPLTDEFGFKLVTKTGYQWFQGAYVSVQESEKVPQSFLTAPHASDYYQRPGEKTLPDKLPVRTNLTDSRYLGKFPAKIGTRPPKVRFIDPVISQYLNTVTKRYGLTRDPENYAVVAGSWATNRSYLEEMACPALPKIPPSLARFKHFWLPVLSEYIRKLKISLLPAPTAQDLSYIDYSPDTYAGIRYDKFLDKPRKRDAAPYALRLAKHLFHQAARKPMCSDALYMMGGREKEEDEALTDGKALSSRGVLMPEFHEDILSSVYSRPIELKFIHQASGPIYLGHSNTHRKWQRYKDDLSFGETVIEGDWRKFDTSVSKELILLSFAILRSFYPKGGAIDNHFVWMVSTFLEKRVVTPGGYVYKISNGVPSGSAWTSIVDTIANFLILCQISYRVLDIKKKTNVRFCVGGDDYLIISKRKIQVETEAFEAFAASQLGIELKEIKVTTPFPDSIHECPTFYKCAIYSGFPTIRPDHLLDLLYCPKSSIRERWEPTNHLLALNSSYPMPLSHTLILLDAYCYYFLSQTKDPGQRDYERVFRNVLLNAWNSFKMITLQPKDDEIVTSLRSGKRPICEELPESRRVPLKPLLSVFGLKTKGTRRVFVPHTY